MDAKLSVEVGAKITELQTKMAQAEKSVATFAGKADKDLAKIAQNGGQSLQNFAKGSNQAAFAVTNLSRVVQDAPFGFIGIQNNLNPLLESFQQLKKETGSNVSAFKALAGQLVGPAGIGFALAAVSAAFLFYQQVTRGAKKETDEFGKSLLTLDELRKEGVKISSQEVSKAQTLYSAATNLNIPLEERLKIVKELKQEYPNYFKSFTNEEILAGKAATAYTNLKNAIIAAGLARASEKQQQEIASRIFDAENTKINAQIKLTETLTKLRQAERLSLTETSEAGQSGLAFTINQLKDNAAGFKAEIKSSDESLKNLNGELNKSLSITDQLVKKYGAGVVTGDVGGSQDTDKQVEKIKSVSDVLKALRVDLQQIANDPGIKTFGEKNAKQFDAYRKAISELTELGTKPANDAIKTLTQTANDIQQPFEKGFKGAQAPVKQTNTELNALGTTIDTVSLKVPKLADKFLEAQNEILSSGFIETFSSIGEAIGESLANGGNLIDAFAKSALESIGSVLIRFGKLTVAAGVASTALGKALSNPFAPGAGVAAIAAGVALIAVGAAVRGFASGIGGGSSESKPPAPRKIPGFASGVRNFSGGLALVGEKGPELVNLPAGSDVIPNHDLSGLGKMQPIVVIPDTVIRGRDIFISYNTEAALAKRNGL